MHERFAAQKHQVPDPVMCRDINNILGFTEGYSAALGRIEPVHSKAAKSTPGIADVGDRELEAAGAAVLEDSGEEVP